MKKSSKKEKSPEILAREAETMLTALSTYPKQKREVKGNIHVL